MNRDICSIVLLAVMCLVSHVLCCSKLEPGARAAETGHDYETDDRKVYYSDVVVFGEVVRTVEGNYPFKGIDGVYTVEFNVLCTYKGGPLPKTIYIAGLGNENGQLPGCPAVPLGGLTQTKKVIMFLKPSKTKNVYEIEFKPNKADAGFAEDILEELSITCGLSLENDGDEICSNYEPLNEKDGCVTWTPVTPLPTPEPEKPTTPEPKETPKSESGDGKPEPTEKAVVDLDGDNKGKDNQSDEGYNTKPGEDSASAEGSKDNGNGSKVVAASILAAILSIILTIVF